MIQSDINAGTRRRLLIAAPGAAALVLATREQGRAKSSRKKKRQARERQAALDAMSVELGGIVSPIGRIRSYGVALGGMVGGSEIGSDLIAIADELESRLGRLQQDLAIARGEATPS